MLGLILIITQAKIDKKLTTLNKGVIKPRYDDLLWIESYEGRVIIYKINIVISFIPFLNIGVCILYFISGLITSCFLFSKLPFWNNGFWNKIF